MDTDVDADAPVPIHSIGAGHATAALAENSVPIHTTHHLFAKQGPEDKEARPRFLVRMDQAYDTLRNFFLNLLNPWGSDPHNVTIYFAVANVLIIAGNAYTSYKNAYESRGVLYLKTGLQLALALLFPTMALPILAVQSLYRYVFSTYKDGPKLTYI